MADRPRLVALNKIDVPEARELADLVAPFREQLVSERRNRFYSSYMAKAREKMRIERNPATLAQIIT